MMQFLLAITMFALIGFSFISADAIHSDDKEMQESMDAYQGLLESMLRDASKQITENAAFDENMDLKSFNQLFDDEQVVITTEEDLEEAADDELSSVEDNRLAENVDSGIRCSWRGLSGRCCQSLRVFVLRFRICLGIQVSPPTYMRLYLKINGMTIWSRHVGLRRKSFNVCIKKGPVMLCFDLYNLHFSRHYIRVCLNIIARLGMFHFRKDFGCINRRYAIDERATLMDKPDPFNVHKRRNGVFPPRGHVPNNSVARFEQ